MQSSSFKSLQYSVLLKGRRVFVLYFSVVYSGWMCACVFVMDARELNTGARNKQSKLNFCLKNNGGSTS